MLANVFYSSNLTPLAGHVKISIKKFLKHLKHGLHSKNTILILAYEILEVGFIVLNI